MKAWRSIDEGLIPTARSGVSRPREQLLRDRFESAYRNLYGHSIDGVNIEVLSWTLTLSEGSEASVSERAAANSAAQVIGTQTFFDPTSTEITDAPVYLRHELSHSCNISGPALITEDQTTTVVPSGFSASINSLGCIVMEVK